VYLLSRYPVLATHHPISFLGIGWRGHRIGFHPRRLGTPSGRFACRRVIRFHDHFVSTEQNVFRAFEKRSFVHNPLLGPLAAFHSASHVIDSHRRLRNVLRYRWCRYPPNSLAIKTREPDQFPVRGRRFRPDNRCHSGYQKDITTLAYRTLYGRVQLYHGFFVRWPS